MGPDTAWGMTAMAACAVCAPQATETVALPICWPSNSALSAEGSPTEGRTEALEVDQVQAAGLSAPVRVNWMVCQAWRVAVAGARVSGAGAGVRTGVGTGAGAEVGASVARDALQPTQRRRRSRQMGTISAAANSRVRAWGRSTDADKRDSKVDM